MADPIVHITNGVPDSGTGNITTLGQTIGSIAAAIPTTATPVGFSDGTNLQFGRIKAASTAPVAADPAIVVAISPNGVNANGRTTPANSAPVVMAKQDYVTVAASQTAQVLQITTGATGDWLDFLLVIPATTAAGAISITDGSGSAISVFAGGGTTALSTLIPFTIPIRAVSRSGAWKVTTGANVSVVASGNFS